MRTARLLPLALLVALGAPALAHAYVDPGAGSMLLQLLLGGAAGLFVLFRLFKDKLRGFLGLRRSHDDH